MIIMAKPRRRRRRRRRKEGRKKKKKKNRKEGRKKKNKKNKKKKNNNNKEEGRRRRWWWWTTTTRLTKSRAQKQLLVSLSVGKPCNTINNNSGRTPFLTKVKLAVQIAKETVTCNNRTETSVLSECCWKRGHVTIDGPKPLSSHWVSGASNLMNVNELWNCSFQLLLIARADFRGEPVWLTGC